MKAEHINPFLSATIEVMATMAHTKVTPKVPYIRENPVCWGVVTGVIPLSGSNVSGCMIISFDNSSVLRIVGKMLGEECRELNQDVTDAVGELTNIISGNAKAALAQSGFEFEMFRPVVIQGKNSEIPNLVDAKTLAIPFSCAAGNFLVEANLIQRV